MQPLDDPGAFLERLAEKQWPTIARQAWKQYQERGRGVVVFSLGQPGAEGKEPLRYLTFSGSEQDLQQSTMKVMYRLVQEYDPQTEAVVAVVLPNQHTVFDVFAAEPAPVDA